MKAHPAAMIFPMLLEPELKLLADDIRQYGLKHSIVVLDGKILDGRNRFEACRLAGVEAKTVEYRGASDPVDFVLSVNLVRRHLTPAQRGAVAVSLLPFYEERNRKKLAEAGKEGGKAGGKGRSNRGGDESTPGLSRDESKRSTSQAAKAVGAGIGTTKAFAKIGDIAPDVFELAKKGQVSASQAKRLADLPEKKRDKAVEAISAGEKPRTVLAAEPKAPAKPKATTWRCPECRTVRDATEKECANCASEQDPAPRAALALVPKGTKTSSVQEDAVDDFHPDVAVYRMVGAIADLFRAWPDDEPFKPVVTALASQLQLAKEREARRKEKAAS